MSHHIRYDPTTCTFSVPDSEMPRLQGKHPYADIRAAIIEAGKHTRAFPEDARRAIEADPNRILELDLRLWLFGPELAVTATIVAVLLVSLAVGRNGAIAAAVSLVGMLAVLVLTRQAGPMVAPTHSWWSEMALR